MPKEYISVGTSLDLLAAASHTPLDYRNADIHLAASLLTETRPLAEFTAATQIGPDDLAGAFNTRFTRWPRSAKVLREFLVQTGLTIDTTPLAQTRTAISALEQGKSVPTDMLTQAAEQVAALNQSFYPLWQHMADRKAWRNLYNDGMGKTARSVDTPAAVYMYSRASMLLPGLIKEFNQHGQLEARDPKWKLLLSYAVALNFEDKSPETALAQACAKHPDLASWPPRQAPGFRPTYTSELS